MELKPCPFCGGQPIEQDVTEYFVQCPSCGVDGPCGTLDRIDDAIEAWNRRADSALDLTGELFTAKQCLATSRKEVESLAAQNRELRKSLRYCKEKAHKPEFIYQITKDALTLPDLSTEPLDRFENEVIEKCASECDEYAKNGSTVA